MPNLITQIATQLPQPTLSAPLQSAGETLRILVEAEAYAGELVSLGYSEALEPIHDHHRQKVGGIPALCFLSATRVNPQTTPDAREEDLKSFLDILDKAISSCLSQLDKLGQLQLVVYYSRKLTKVELNYNVYNKEMLAIVKCFRT